ncbi:uncharacterized protein BJX67DRAFT_365956, partial [Aspergillus lucknowensis]
MSPCRNQPQQPKVDSRPHKTPAYWDNLSTIWLTRGALRELQRRIKKPRAQTSRRYHLPL